MCDAADAPSQSKSNCFFAPMVSRYAAIRIDPVAAVQAYDYHDIQEAARRMQTKTYVVFVDMALGLPWPNSLWYSYSIIPVAPCLRPADEERGATPDMCIPIHPNIGHPREHEGVRTEPGFPFDNCYHWTDHRFTMDVRVRPSPDGFDDDLSYKLAPAERTKSVRFVREDYARMRAIREGQSQPAQAQPACVSSSHEVSESSTEPGHEVEQHKDAVIAASATPLGASLDAEGSSESPRAPAASEALLDSDTTQSADGDSIGDSYDADGASHEPVTRSTAEEIEIWMSVKRRLEEYRRKTELYPLVDLWYDLPAHLKQDEIPNPLGLFKERDELNRSVPLRLSLQGSCPADYK
ncbi:hypothetical protein OH76DRAFT_647253 [Lentinus brumalis]|uniref:Uncharacterized protein n=1 Tax=Lentinus brumalis TaxID=2498619 RepID=A0A371D803_9APHY|nr:hypothetical protein OH76DRAFT_647253 [Polyporus brumalis]